MGGCPKIEVPQIMQVMDDHDLVLKAFEPHGDVGHLVAADVDISPVEQSVCKWRD